jgi:hypothetical protein
VRIQRHRPVTGFGSAVFVAALLPLAACSSGSSSGKAATPCTLSRSYSQLPNCTPTTTAATLSTVGRIVAQQTELYEHAGLTSTEAACLANVTGRIHPPKGVKFVIGTEAQSNAIDHCHINPTRLNKVGDYIDKHPPGSQLVVVPNVTGEAMCPAVSAVAHAGLRPTPRPPRGRAAQILPTSWRVASQQPAAGRRVRAGSTVSLFLVSVAPKAAAGLKGSSLWVCKVRVHKSK